MTDIEVRIVDPETGQVLRVYGIIEGRTLLPDLKFSLDIAHRRIGQKFRRRTKLFTSYSQLERYRKDLLRKAYRRGYPPPSQPVNAHDSSAGPGDAQGDYSAAP